MEAGLALAGLLLTAPLIGLAAFAIAVTSGLPVFFRQLRVGRGGKPFTLVKLRTMRPSVDGPQVTAKQDTRVTPVGRLLRKTKLDELPELWNILRGDMSFVGPRPEVARYVDLDNPLWIEILRVRPGLTDPMTLRLRDEEALMEAVEGDRDRYYRETLQPMKLEGYRSYLLERTWRSDLFVIFDTIRVLLAGLGAGRPSEQGTSLPGRPPRA